MSVTTTIGARRIALEAARLTVTDPATVLVLAGVQLVFFVALWAAAAWAFGGALVHRPTPSAFDLLALALSDPGGLRRLLLGWGVIGGLYLLGGALISGALLVRLQSRGAPARRPALRTALRHLVPLLLLRLMALGLVALVATGGVVALPWVFDRSLAIVDERLQALLLVGAALPLLLAALASALILHYGQPLLLEGCGLRAVMGESLALVHRRPLGTGGLYVGGWLLWSGVTALQMAGLPAVVAALLRVAVHAWSYAAALQAARVWRTAGR